MSLPLHGTLVIVPRKRMFKTLKTNFMDHKLLLARRHKKTFQKLPKSYTWKTFESTNIFSNRETFVLKFWAFFKCMNICFVQTNIFWNAWIVFEFMNICFVQTNIFWNACIFFELMNIFWVSNLFCIDELFL